MKVPTKKTNVYLLEPIAELMRKDVRRFAKIKAVINAALWMFHTANPEAKDRAIDDVADIESGRPVSEVLRNLQAAGLAQVDQLSERESQKAHSGKKRAGGTGAA